MTAEQALRNKEVFHAIEEGARTGEKSVRAFLKGVPPAHDDLARDISRAAEAAGVDLATIPVLEPGEVARERKRRNGRCRRCRELADRVAELEEQLAGRPVACPPPAPEVPERAVDAPTQAPIPLHRPRPEKRPIVKLEGFPAEALEPDDEPDTPAELAELGV